MYAAVVAEFVILAAASAISAACAGGTSLGTCMASLGL